MLKQKQVIYLKRKSVKKKDILANWLLVLLFPERKNARHSGLDWEVSVYLREGSGGWDVAVGYTD